MAILANVLLGVLAGQYAMLARSEHIWWPYFSADVSTLKSRVPASVRADSESFYRQLLKAPPNFDYVIAAFAAIILLSLVGGIVQHPSKRIFNILSLITFGAAAGVEIVLARPLLLSFAVKTYRKPDVQAESLLKLSLYHAITLGLLIVTILLQVSADEQEEERAAKATAATKKEAKKPKAD
ncbi:hypothetical protein HK105_204334 [Polyrhizophydium stewartii]|uniref:Uncharacterized protein n=1 Tax=Polyrhizophydium stewartii TaxID=2732419 RepID=A0ABR4N9M8_9FUNG|nr:hypothetical protein HK105_002166 [Polyrhizophydium stewartii]